MQGCFQLNISARFLRTLAAAHVVLPHKFQNLRIRMDFRRLLYTLAIAAHSGICTYLAQIFQCHSATVLAHPIIVMVGFALTLVIFDGILFQIKAEPYVIIFTTASFNICFYIKGFRSVLALLGPDSGNLSFCQHLLRPQVGDILCTQMPDVFFVIHIFPSDLPVFRHCFPA